MRLDPLIDLGGISGAPRPDDLWRWLVGRRSNVAETNTFLAETTFRHLHRDDTRDAWRTAALLCTDPRWRQVTGRLVRALDASGLVGDEQLDDLADAFVLEDQYDWPVPDTWVRDGTVRVNRRAVPPGASSPPAVIERRIEPPLRRWGAGRVIRRGRRTVGELLDRVGSLPAHTGDYVLLGLLDACEALDEQTRDTVIDLGVTWTSGTVRLGALQQVVARDGREAAARRAESDPNEKVRRWGATLRQHDGAAPGDAGGDGGVIEPSDDADDAGTVVQEALFDL